MSKTLDDDIRKILEDYQKEIQRYRCRRDIALRIFDQLGEAQFQGDAPKLRQYLQDPIHADSPLTAQMRKIAEDVLDEYQLLLAQHNASSSDVVQNKTFKAKDLAEIIEQNEVELRLGTTAYRQVYWDTLNKSLSKAAKDGPTSADRDVAKTVHGAVEHILEEGLGTLWWVTANNPFSSSDIFFIPCYATAKEFISKHEAGFYEREYVLPAVDKSKKGRRGFRRSVAFDKFFGNKFDWLKNNCLSDYLSRIGLPFLDIFAKKTSGDNYVTTTELLEGSEVGKKLGKSYRENRKWLMGIVEALAATHYKGKKRRTQLESHPDYKKIKDSLELDLRTYFIQNYTLRRRYGKSELEKRGLDWQDPDQKVIEDIHKAILRRSGEGYDKYKKLYKELEDKVLKVLETEISARAGQLDLLHMDAHSSNLWVKESQQEADPSKDIVILDPELCMFGLGVFDLYRVLEDPRNRIAEADYERAKKELINHYVKQVTKRDGELSEAALKEAISRTTKLYDAMRCLQDFTMYARLDDHAKTKKTLSKEEKRLYGEMAKEYRERGIAFLRDQTRTRKDLTALYEEYVNPGTGTLRNGDQMLTAATELGTLRYELQPAWVKGIRNVTKSLRLPKISKEKAKAYLKPLIATATIAAQALAGSHIPEHYHLPTPEKPCMPIGRSLDIYLTGSPEWVLRTKCGFSGTAAHEIVNYSIENRDNYRWNRNQLEIKTNGKWRTPQRDDIMRFSIPSGVSAQ